MNWVIIIVLLVSILGSMLWMMPSPMQRHQAKMRQLAMKAGLNIQMVKLKCPRAIGEAEAQELDCMAYRLSRAGGDKLAMKISPWQVFRLHGHADRDLPEGWCWGKGEKLLNEQQLGILKEMISTLPKDVLAIESTPLAASVYWYEREVESSVETIKEELSKLVEQRF